MGWLFSLAQAGTECENDITIYKNCVTHSRPMMLNFVF